MRTEIITRNLYQFDELSEAAKEKARDWYRQCIDSNDFDYVIEDAKTIAALMGIEIENIYYSLSYSQGDGACFEGSYSYKKGSVKAVKDYAPLDKELHRIVEALSEVQKSDGYKLTAKVKSGRYSSSAWAEIEVDRSDNFQSSEMESYEEIKMHLKDFMDWIYKQLLKEDEYLNSNESIDENIRANEYEFLESGKRA